ncbi:MAG: ABC transporter ATP-binding protein [Spirochaetota bacterium]|nr:MAG: ABC transporter ATP-binding protein [Spirochaetota bacterium]
MARVILENITKTYGQVLAVGDVSVTVEDKEFLAILGPSGCGKTTLLRIIAGLIEPDKGSIYFDDVDISHLYPRDRGVAMVFENYALYPHMTVYGNVSYPLRAGKKRFSKPEIREKVLSALKLLNISDLINRLPKELSGGQKQRVAVARSLVLPSNVFLFDEVLSALDAKLRARMRGEIRRLQKDLGITAILVTHDQVEATAMADRILLMKDGVVQQIGTAHELFNKCRNTFVASFIGSPEMNLLDCEIKREDATTYLVGDSIKVPISKELAKKIDERKTTSELVLGCRPAHVILNPQASSNRNMAKGNIFIFEQLGMEQLVEVAIGNTDVRAIAPATMSLEIDQPVGLEFPEEKLFVFDKATTLNIGL